MGCSAHSVGRMHCTPQIKRPKRSIMPSAVEAGEGGWDSKHSRLRSAEELNVEYAWKRSLQSHGHFRAEGLVFSRVVITPFVSSASGDGGKEALLIPKWSGP